MVAGLTPAVNILDTRRPITVAYIIFEMA